MICADDNKEMGILGYIASFGRMRVAPCDETISDGLIFCGYLGGSMIFLSALAGLVGWVVCYPMWLPSLCSTYQVARIVKIFSDERDIL